MWQPEPGWQRLSGGGPSTVGLWRAQDRGRDVVVKRLQAPAAHDPAGMSSPTNPAYWRRDADVALAGDLASTAGLRAPEVLRVEEDVEGITVITTRVEPAPLSGLFLARALGRFAGESLPERPWWARDQLRTRLGHVAHRGGWQVLARTTVADAADHLWRRRESYLAQLDALPQVPQHGDPVAANLLAPAPTHEGASPDTVLAVDWATVGRGPVGGDLGYFVLSSREEFDPLLEAYVSGLPDGVATRAQVLLGARITAVFTVLTQADWALARVAGGEGALAGKFRHPSVAPHLRSLQRQFAHLEALMG